MGAAIFGIFSFIQEFNLFDIGMSKKGILVFACLSSLSAYLLEVILRKFFKKKLP